MKIKGFIETSLIDWDGMVSCVLFLPGCNFNCPFCHNHLLARHPERLADVPWERVENYLADKVDWIDGAVVTGGEPTIHQELKPLLVKIRDLKSKIKLDTNGYRPVVLEELFSEDLVDYVAMDVKAPLDGSYAVASGTEVDVMQIRRSVSLIMGSGLPYEFRTTLVPGLHDLGSVRRMGRELKGARKWALQQFVPAQAGDRSLRSAVPLGEEALLEMQREAREMVERCIVRGLRQVAEAPPN